MERLDGLASEVQYVDHVLPAWSSTGSRGVFWTSSEPLADRVRGLAPGADVRVLGRLDGLPRPVLVGSHRDLAIARRRRAPGVAYMEHGCGQSYGGDRRTARHPSYAGGSGREGVGVILAPNVVAGNRWAERYPGTPVHVIGATRVLTPPEDPASPLLVVSFHWQGGLPELRGSLGHYRGGLPRLAEELPVAGHAHPRFESTARRVFERAGIPYLADLAEVARRATVYAVDNSSTLWELGRTRPVIALDAPWYRRHVTHGLRFWSHVPLAVDGPDALLDAARRLLARGEDDAERARREAIVAEVIPYLDGATRAGTLLDDWLRTRHSHAAVTPRARGVRIGRRAETGCYVAHTASVDGGTLG